MGNPAAVIVRASDSPSSRPPSRRWTTTLTRGARWEGSSGEPVGVAVLTSLMTVRARRMLAPASPRALSLKMRAASAEPLRRPPAVEHPLRAGHPLGDALHLNV